MPSIQLPWTQMFPSCQLHLANWPRDKSWDYMKKRGHRVVTWEDSTQPVPVKGKQIEIMIYTKVCLIIKIS